MSNYFLDDTPPRILRSQSANAIGYRSPPNFGMYTRILPQDENFHSSIPSRVGYVIKDRYMYSPQRPPLKKMDEIDIRTASIHPYPQEQQIKYNYYSSSINELPNINENDFIRQKSVNEKQKEKEDLKNEKIKHELKLQKYKLEVEKKKKRNN